MGTNRIQILRALNLRRKTVLTTVALGILATIGAAALLPRKYTSQSAILLRLGRENLAVDPTVVSDVTVAPIDTKRENEVNSEVRILKSRQLAEETVAKIGTDLILGGAGSGSEDENFVQRFSGILREKGDRLRGVLQANGLSESMTPDQLAVHKIQRSFFVQPIRNSEVIELSYRHRDAERATEILSVLLDLYLDRHLEVRKTSGAIDFFEAQAEQSGEELGRREKALADFRSREEIHSVKLEREILLQKIADVDKEAADFRGWIAGEEERRARFLEEFSLQPERLEAETVDGKPNYGLTPVYDRLAHLFIEESSLSTRFTDSYQPLQDVREQITVLKGFLEELPTTLREDATRPNQVRINLNSEVVHSEARLASLHQKMKVKVEFLERSGQRLVHLEQLELEDKRLAWEIEIARRRHSQCLTDLDQARTSSALDLEKISNVAIIDPPAVPLRPEGLSKAAVLVFGLLGTLLFATGLALVLEYADRSYKSPDEISEMMQLPTLATVRRGYELETFAKI